MNYMEIAISEAYEGIRLKHGGPFGSVVVKDGQVVGRGHNRVLVDHDPTSHGEIVAIRDACKNLGTHDLSGCELYTTAAPCPMCKGAILWANVSKVYYGCNTRDSDRIGFRDDEFFEKWNSFDGEGNDFGQELDRQLCLKLFDDYANLEHELY